MTKRGKSKKKNVNEDNELEEYIEDIIITEKHEREDFEEDDDNVVEEEEENEIINEDDDVFDIIDEETKEEEEDDENDLEDLEEYNANKDYKLRKNKITFPKITKFEKTLILSQRAQQLMNNNKPNIDISDMDLNDINIFYKIALREYNENKIPFNIKRELHDNTYEVWSLEEFKYK